MCPKGKDCDFFEESLNGCDRDGKICEQIGDIPVEVLETEDED